MTTRHLLVTVPMLAAVFFAASRPAAADDCLKYAARPATADERKIYADGYALFLRTAPPAPIGWESSDAQKSGVLNTVCAPATERVADHGFQRNYAQKDGVAARQAVAANRAAAVGRDLQATAKSNEAKLADIQARIKALQTKMQEAVKVQRMQEVEKLMAQSEALVQEYEKALNVSGTQAATDAIDAEARRDTIASFNVRINWPAVDTRSYTPVTIGTTRAFRQLTPAQGANPASTIIIVPLGPPTGPRTVVTVTGDPVRAEELLKAAKLQ